MFLEKFSLLLENVLLNEFVFLKSACHHDWIKSWSAIPTDMCFSHAYFELFSEIVKA